MTTYFTTRGLEHLEESISKQIQLVMEAGKQVGDEAGISCDWHDNFGYEDAKRRLELESTRLEALKRIRESAQIFDVDHQDTSIANIGAKVAFLIDDEPKEITIGGWGETKPELSLVSYESPLARLVLGMRVGEIRDARFRDKDIEIEITRITYDKVSFLRLLGGLYGT